MSTNFYLVPHRHIDIENNLYKLRDEYNEKLRVLSEEYKEKIKDYVCELSKDESLVMSYGYNDDCDEFLTRLELPTLWEYSLPKIHIGLRSGGWKFLFQACDEFNSFEEFKNYYNENKNKLMIIDEYDKEYSLDEFIEEVNETYSKKDNISHIEYVKNNSFDYFTFEFRSDYFVDDKGYEFSKRQFS